MECSATTTESDDEDTELTMAMEHEWRLMKEGIALANQVHSDDAQVGGFHRKLKRAIRDAVDDCRTERKRARADQPVVDLSDASMRDAAQFTDSLPLADYDGILHLVPRLVNVVTLAEAIPVAGSGLKLPLDLHAIGARCSNAYFAPRRFAAVQLAFSNPRCRVLIFHTGRLVGTGCSGPMAARLAILKAARQLAVEAGVYVHVRKFSVINEVGAVSIDARLDCDAFASTHSATSHYDRASFVGLAWRPGGEAVCCEIYSTGKANLPGSTRQRDLLASFARMVSELLRHSDRPEVRDRLKPHLRYCHRPREVTRDDAPAAHTSKKQKATKPAKVSAPVNDLFGGDWAMEPLEAMPAIHLTDTDTTDLLARAGLFMG